jgi:hypothetical protein
MATAKTAVPRKRLIVSYLDDAKTPDFKFDGLWTGFEISTVASNLRRAYLKTKRDQRRAESSETSNNSTKETP